MTATLQLNLFDNPRVQPQGKPQGITQGLNPRPGPAQTSHQPEACSSTRYTPQTPFPPSHHRYLHNRARSALANARHLDLPCIDIVPDDADTWLGWRLLPAAEGIPLDGLTPDELVAHLLELL
jgi:hypothetical protein